MSNPNWTHTLTSFDDSDSRIVSPSGDWELAIKGAWEDLSFCRDYRLKIEGEMIFSGGDFLWIKDQDCFTQMKYKIECDGSTIFNGYFSYPHDCEIDNDRCQISATPFPNDKYTQFDDTADEQHQLDDHDHVVALEFDGVPAPNIGGDTWICRDECSLLYEITQQLLIDTISVGAAAGSPLSVFFWNDLRPDGVNIGTANYVSSVDPNPLNWTGFIMTDNMAQAASPEYPYYSWNEWMEILHDFFNVWWYIDDEDNKIRIEHIYWWEGYWFGAGDNLVTMDNGHWIENTNKYQWLNNEMPIIEEWDMDNDYQTALGDFDDNYDIRYSSEAFHPYAAGYFIRTYAVPDLSTDVEYTVPAADGGDGFMFLMMIRYVDYLWTDPGNTAPDGTPRPNLATACSGAPPVYIVWYELGAVTAANHINAHMAITNIVEAYWYRWRPQLDATWLGGAVTFDTQEPLVVQRDLAYPKCCQKEDNEFLLHIVTQYGWGYIRAASLTQDGMLSKLELLHTIACT